MKLSSFQEDLDDWVAQKSEDEVCFRLPLAYRLITLVLAVGTGGFSVWAIFLSGDVAKSFFGMCVAVICLLLVYSSLPRELHLDFRARTYRKVFGIGWLAFRTSGTFDDIINITIRKRGSGKSVPSLSAIMTFRKPEKPSPTPLPLDWHLVSTEPEKEPALRRYASGLAAKIRVPMLVVNR